MAMMTHRERARIALTGGQPDYVPTFELAFYETERDFQGRVFHGTPGLPASPAHVPRREIVEHNAKLYRDVARQFEHSIILVCPWDGGAPDRTEQLVDLLRALRELSGDEYCLMTPGDPTFKIPGNPEAFVVRLYEDPAGLKREAQRRLDTQRRLYDAVFEAGADGIVLASDYAFNAGPFLSPTQFGEFVTPYLAQAVAEIRAHGGLAIKHSDGNLMPVLDQIVAAAPHALHSIDPMAGMDIRAIKAQYGRCLALCGNVHCAWLQSGTPAQVRASAEYCLTQAKPGGGYVFSTSNCVFRGMPLASYDLIHALWRAQRTYPARPEDGG